tara:strand:- start:68 stop:430 length:363 start_codon:yes stop_codon:yes gene_type:complete
MGWYGICGFDCQPFDLRWSEHREKIFRVIQINRLHDNYSVFNSSYDPAADAFQDFTELECQRPYLIILKQGTGQLVIPGFIEASALSENVGLLTRWCGPIKYSADIPTPTPTPEQQSDDS